jgi:glycosyltransferase involved in cell wall biosynthesis
MMVPPLSVSIVTCNEERNLPRCLASVAGLAAEIIVMDSGSTDTTRHVAASAGARVIHQDWLGYRDQKNAALSHCTQAWVLALDADEELSPGLRAEIEGFFQTGETERYHGASFPRKVWFLGRWITHGDWYPDRKLRLVRRDGARWMGSPEHDFLEVPGPVKKLACDLHHFSFPDTATYLRKITVFADEYLKRELAAGRRWSLAGNVTRPLWRFFRGYVLRRGFLDGFPGLWIATGIAFQTFVRHSRTYEYAVKERRPDEQGAAAR